MVFHDFWLVSMVFQGGFMVYHGSWLVSMVFQGGFIIFHGFWLVSIVFQGGFMVFHGYRRGRVKNIPKIWEREENEKICSHNLGKGTGNPAQPCRRPA